MPVPLHALVCVSAVSGSGKSTLVRQVLQVSLAGLLDARRARRRAASKPLLVGCRALAGWESIGRVLEVDQAPIGNTRRSCPAIDVGFWDAIRWLFAPLPEATLRGYGPGRACPDSWGKGAR